MYEKKEIILNHKILERFMLYISKEKIMEAIGRKKEGTLQTSAEDIRIRRKQNDLVMRDRIFSND